MEKKILMDSIALSALQIGIRRSKSFISYDIYRVFPRLISIATFSIGVFQLSSIYNRSNSEVGKELISVFLLIIGVFGISLDFLSDGKENLIMQEKN
jgi:hypothetical protein